MKHVKYGNYADILRLLHFKLRFHVIVLYRILLPMQI